MLKENRIIACPYTPVPEEKSGAEPASQAGNQVNQDSNGVKQSANNEVTAGLMAWQIYDTVTAGTPGVVGYDATPIGEVRINQFLINNKPYYPHNLVAGSEPLRDMRALHDLCVVRVQGDSMDLCNINDGDYVLLRKAQNAADGDIVVAQVPEPPDFCANIKRYRVLKDGSVELKPESNNLSYKPHAFQPDGSETRIIGIAIVALKPVK